MRKLSTGKRSIFRPVGQWVKRGAALALSTVLVASGAVVFEAAPSWAAVSGITDVKITQPMDGVSVDESIRIDAKWVAGDLVSGDTFSLALPNPPFAGHPGSFDLKTPGGDSAGTCVVSASEIVCTLNDYVTTHSGVEGTLYFWATATKEYNQGTVLFETDGGVTYTVPIPGGKVDPITDNDEWPTGSFKHGVIDYDERQVNWALYLRSSELLLAGGNPVLITDTYDARLSTIGTPIIWWVTKAQWEAPGSPWDVAFSSNQKLVSGTDYTYNAGPNANQFQISINPTVIKSDRMYMVEYKTALPANIADGAVYTNHVAMGTWSSSSKVTYSGAGGGAAGNSLVVKKSATPASSTGVNRNDTVAYSVSVTNMGDITLNEATLKDDLTDVFDDADLVPGSLKATTGWNPPTVTGDELNWVGKLEPGESVTLSYSVKVKADAAGGAKLLNTVVASGKTLSGTDVPSNCVYGTEEDCTTEHPLVDVPAIKVVKDDHKTVLGKGESTTYDVTVTNTGKGAATDVVVTDTLPAELEYVSSTDGGVYDAVAHTVTWTLASLDAVTGTHTFQVVAKVAAGVKPGAEIRNVVVVDTKQGCVDDPATPADECGSTDIDRVPAVSITKDDGKTIVRSGETLKYVLTAKNTSSVDAPNVVVTDTLPKNVTFVESSIPGTQSVTDAYTFEWSLGTLKAGEERSITVTVKVHGGLAADTEIVNTAKITTNGLCVDDPATDADECNATDIDTTPSDVWILKDDHKTEVKPGEELTYDLTVGNNSKVKTITDVVVTDKLPVNTEFVSASNGGVLSADGKSVTWKFGTLEPGKTVKVKVTVKVALAAKAGDEVLNTAVVDIPGGCIQEDACETKDRDIVPKLSIVKDDHKQNVAPGDRLTYDVTVTNETDVVADNVVVSDRLPDNVTYVSASEGGSYDSASRTVTWKLAPLAGKSSVKVQVTVTVNDSATGSVVNTAKYTSPTGCVTEGGCESTDTDTLQQLSVTGAEGAGLLATGGVLLLAVGAGALFLTRRRKQVAE